MSHEAEHSAMLDLRRLQLATAAETAGVPGDRLRVLPNLFGAELSRGMVLSVRAGAAVLGVGFEVSGAGAAGRVRQWLVETWQLEAPPAELLGDALFIDVEESHQGVRVELGCGTRRFWIDEDVRTLTRRRLDDASLLEPEMARAADVLEASGVDAPWLDAGAVPGLALTWEQVPITQAIRQVAILAPGRRIGGRLGALVSTVAEPGETAERLVLRWDGGRVELSIGVRAQGLPSVGEA